VVFVLGSLLSTFFCVCLCLSLSSSCSILPHILYICISFPLHDSFPRFSSPLLAVNMLGVSRSLSCLVRSVCSFIHLTLIYISLNQHSMRFFPLFPLLLSHQFHYHISLLIITPHTTLQSVCLLHNSSILVKSLCPSLLEND
jgi:hypothetical protein